MGCFSAVFTDEQSLVTAKAIRIIRAEGASNAFWQQGVKVFPSTKLRGKLP
jgi:hypothetical protein